MQVAFGEDDAVAVESLAVAAVAGKGLQVGFRQGVLGGILIYALGNGEVAAIGKLLRRSHADLGTGTKRTADRDGLTSGQIDVGRVAGDIHLPGNDEVIAVHIHTAVISRDGTAVHMKPLIITHAGTVSADTTTIHNESAIVFYVHAGGFRAGDFSVARFAAIAVAQRQRRVFPDVDHITGCTVFQFNTVPVQAEYEPHFV